MKKTFIFLLLILIAFGSCTKEEESIDGTMWSVTTNGIYRTISFDKTICTYTYWYSDMEITTTYPYTLDYPVVSMQGESPYADLRGSINGNTMVVTNMSTHETLGIFIKNY